MESDYFRNYMNLITKSGLLDILKENDIRLVIYLHPKFAQYIENFKGLPEDVVECIPFGARPLNEIMMRAEMLITDYSSVCWDMMFMDKPVVFYQFDRDTYLQAHGSYIDFDTELPGDKTLDGNQVVEYVKDYIANGFKIKEEYQDDVNAFFMYKDDKNCQRTYDFLMDKLAQM
jgi:CDP-glycerol glycerophosphotransferase (TagB/SpsB family)